MNESSGRSGFREGFLGGLDPLTALAIVVIGLASLEITVGAIQVGITTDEPMHTYRTQTLLDSGWYIPGYLLEEGKPSSDPIATPFVYGPGFSMPAHLLARLLGIEEAGLVSEEKGAWAFRHLVLAMIALLTAFSVWLCVRALTGSRRAATWSSAALLCIPIWLGSGMFNIKDLPVAAGYTLFTTGLVLPLVGRRPLARSGFRTVMALCAVGVLLSIGVRFAMWVPIALSASLWLVMVLAQRRGGAVAVRPSFEAVGFGSLIGLALIAVMYPAAFSNPIELLIRSIQDSAGYFLSMTTLTAGIEVPSQSPPIWYLPIWTFAVIPLLIGGFALIGLLACFGAVVASVRESGIPAFAAGSLAPVLLVVVQFALMPVGGAVTGATAYNGIRQYLFIVPALAILAGFGFVYLWKSGFMNAPSREWRRLALVVVASAALVMPFLEQSRLFPYNYTYINPVAGIGGVKGNWVSDFWAASLREAAQRTPAGGTVACSFNVESESFTTCGKNWVLQFLPEGATPFDPANPSEDPVRILVPEFKPTAVPDYCQLEDTVSRRLRFERVAMSKILLCDPQMVAASFR